MVSAAATDVNGFDIPGLSVSWSSSNAGVATVNAAGVVTAAANGTATITATSGGLSDQMTVTVEQAVAQVAVTPTDATLRTVGSTVQLTGTAGDANGHAVADSAVAWTSSDTTVATVAETGLVTAIEEGTATITGSVAGFEGTAAITVVLPVASVTVSPGADTIAVGGSAPLTATVADSGGTALADRVVTWSSADTAIATVDSTGSVTGVAVGTTTITAESGGVSGDATVVVESAPVASVDITGQDAHALYITNASGYPDSLQLTATPKDANGNSLSRSVTWMSLDTTQAKVSNTGLVTDGAYLVGDSVGIVATTPPESGL